MSRVQVSETGRRDRSPTVGGRRVVTAAVIERGSSSSRKSETRGKSRKPEVCKYCPSWEGRCSGTEGRGEMTGTSTRRQCPTDSQNGRIYSRKAGAKAHEKEKPWGTSQSMGNH